MWFVKSHIGLAEWGVLAGMMALITAEAAAIIMGVGAIFAVIGLGYFLVIAVIYSLYRQERASCDALASAEAGSKDIMLDHPVVQDTSGNHRRRVQVLQEESSLRSDQQ